MFRRRSKVEDVDEDALDETDLGNDELDSDETDSEPAAAQPRSAPARPQGPIDVADVRADDDTARIDLGSLQIPVPEGLEIRVDVQDDILVAATLVDGKSELQVHAFAAPRTAGLWTEVREEIADSLRSNGGGADEVEGGFGPELRARVPVEGGGTQPARFIGVDGPRWFVRGLVTGPASTDPAQATRLEQAFRTVVVNRGGEAMAPRDMLPLRLPPDAMTEEPVPEETDHSLELFERGPEITEIQ